MAFKQFPQTGGGITYITSGTASAGSAISINGCFSTAYENYLIVGLFTGSTGNAPLNFRLRLSGTDATGADYNWARVFGVGATPSSSRTTGATLIELTTLNSVGVSPFEFQILRPNVAAATALIGKDGYIVNDNALEPESRAGAHKLATAYDGFSIYPNSGTFTGTVRVYGYNNS